MKTIPRGPVRIEIFESREPTDIVFSSIDLHIGSAQVCLAIVEAKKRKETAEVCRVVAIAEALKLARDIVAKLEAM